MKLGIYFAYWEHHWGGDYAKYAGKVGGLGFDILEISCAPLPGMSDAAVKELRRAGDDAGIGFTGNYGPKPEEDISSSDPGVVRNTFEFWKKSFDVLNRLGVSMVSGGLYSYWPVDYTKPVNKKEDLKRSVDNMRKLGELASQFNIALGMEVLNRFEGYLLNTAEEAVDYVKAVGLDNIKVMLDTFHMNIEEDSLTEAIHRAGKYLGHFHIGEPNRRPPRAGSRLDWEGIGKALRAIGYTGAAVMEPFVMEGGQIGKEIKVWRDLSNNAGEKELDEEARKSVNYIRSVF
jgi:D-psicose/D-tagatose/L-ribulose 3-epimerase